MHPLRAKRQEAGLSTRALAARVGLHRNQIERIERGETDMRVKDLLALAAELGCEASEIMPPLERRPIDDIVA